MAYLASQPDANLLDVFRQTPELSRRLHGFAEVLMRGPSPFSPAQREAIAVRVSRANGCRYCSDSHGAAARNLGLAADELELLASAAPAEVPHLAMSPVLGLFDKLNSTPAEVERADVEAVLEAGWDEQALHHAVLVCGFFNLMNRWVDGLGIEADPAVVAKAGEMLAAKGYEGIPIE